MGLGKNLDGIKNYVGVTKKDDTAGVCEERRGRKGGSREKRKGVAKRDH